MKKTLSKYIVEPQTTIIETMGIIDAGAKGIVYVCENNILKAVVTDGDIRRFILKNGDLKTKIVEIANPNVKCIDIAAGIDSKEYMLDKKITSVPIVSSSGQIIAIDFLHGEKIYKNTNLKTPVVIMAGGKGTRLLPYTNVLPKPLIPIGDKTITEHILDQFRKFGCEQFSIILNYKKNLIQAYFQELEMSDKVEFVEEQEFLGTGGGLKLLAAKLDRTFFMTNCDVLIEEDYSAMLDYHKQQGNIITLVCAVKKITIPYGTVILNSEGQIDNFQEKPSFSFITNTGFYIIEPEFLKYIPENEFIHITDVIQNCLAATEKVGIYPVSEASWMDMGEFSELDKMKQRIEDMKM